MSISFMEVVYFMVYWLVFNRTLSMYESELQAQLIPTEFHPKLHYFTHQPNEPSDNNAYKAMNNNDLRINDF